MNKRLMRPYSKRINRGGKTGIALLGLLVLAGIVLLVYYVKSSARHDEVELWKEDFYTEEDIYEPPRLYHTTPQPEAITVEERPDGRSSSVGLSSPNRYMDEPPRRPLSSAALDEVDTHVFEVVEVWPEFPGGQVALMRYLNHHIQYPPIARENAIEGRVICKFIIEKDGSISDVQVVRGVEPSLDREAVRVIESMPRWIPGQHHTEIVRVRFTMPVIFRLS